MAFADLLELVGSTGRFQIIHVTLLSLPILMMASHNLLQNFVALVPPHHCQAPKNISALHLDPGQAVRLFVPLEADGQLSRCRRYATPQWHLQASNTSSRPAAGSSPGATDTLSKDLQGCEDGWKYNTSEMSSTIISEWDLVCDLRSYKQMGQSVYMGGVLVGAVVFGGLADRFGRRMLLLISHLLMAVSGTCAAFAPSFSLFCLFRFLCGMALSGMVLNSFSLILEWIPTKVRTVVGTATGYCYTMGQLILAGVAYFVRDWRWLTLAVSMPFYISFLYSWWLQESARWLVLNRKPEQAVKNLRVVAHINGREAQGRRINAEMLQGSMMKEMSCSRGTDSAMDPVPHIRHKSHHHPPECRLVLHKFRLLRLIHGPPKVRSGHLPDPGDLRGGGHPCQGHRRRVHEQNWQATVPVCRPHPGRGHHPREPGSAVRYGDLQAFGWFLPTVTLRHSCGTLVLLFVTCAEMQILRTSLAVVGKGCLAASFNCCYLYSGELYPTVIRQNGMGWVSMMARIGAMVAPMVLLLGETVAWLPGLIYGGAPIIAGIFAIFLPETLAVPLPDTIQDMEERTCRNQPFKGSFKQHEVPLKDLASSVQKEVI